MAQTADTPETGNPTRGIFWMVVTGLCFVAVTALVKTLGPGVPAAEAAFLRYLLGIVFLIPLIRPLMAARLTARHWTWAASRGLVHSFGVMLWFFAMTQIPIAEVTAMNYLAPIYVTIGAVIVFKEKLAARRMIAIAMALIGALIILRPGFREVNLGHLAMLVAAVVFAASYMLAKMLADEVSPEAVVGLLSVFVTLGLAPFAWAVWIPPSWSDLGFLLAVALFAQAGHYTMTLAFRAAPMTVTQPVTFLQLLWATLLGALVFNEAVDIWVVTGGVIILGSVTFITWREAMLKRKHITPPTPATKV